jgi:hypothetical protein
MTSENITGEDLLEKYPRQKEGIEIIMDQTIGTSDEYRFSVFNTLARYMEEADKKSYTADVSELVRFIRDKEIFSDSSVLYDLGAGSGQLVNELALTYPEKEIVGVDLCPGFVSNFNDSTEKPSNASMKVGLIDSGRCYMPYNNPTGAVSVLTLDRLANPRSLIRLMRQFCRGRMLATLLPIVPEDDNPSRQDNQKKIVYTQPWNRITPGQNENDDRNALEALLQEEWMTELRGSRPLSFDKVPYAVTSSGDRQNYELGVFYTS